MTRAAAAQDSPWPELLLVLATGGLHLLAEHFGAKGPFIAGATVVWAVWVACKIRVPGQATAWGMRTDTLAPSASANGALLVLASAGMVAFGVAHGRGSPPGGFFILLALYPVWGLVQQFLLCAIVARDLERVTGSRAAAVAIGAFLFGLVHAPDWVLCGLTAAAGVFWTACFLRWPNLWVHGVVHGWLGGMAYWFVLGKDAWGDLMTGLGTMQK
jgi:hypothetical protein